MNELQRICKLCAVAVRNFSDLFQEQYIQPSSAYGIIFSEEKRQKQAACGVAEQAENQCLKKLDESASGIKIKLSGVS